MTAPIMEEATDKEVTVRVPAPQPDWESSVRIHQRAVVMSVVALGLRLDRAEEIAQLAWTRLIEKSDRGELPVVELPGLAIKQARFLARDELRKLGREQRRRVSPGDITLLDDRADPERNILAKEDLERALAAIASCSASAQRVFRAFYDNPRRPHKDIAHELGISVQRVRQTLCEVRKRVRDALETDDD